MKKILLVITGLLLAALPVLALDVTGEAATEVRVDLDTGDYLYNQEKGALTFESQVNDNLYCRLRLGIDYYNNPVSSTAFTGNLQSRELGMLYSVYPVEIELEEAYITYSDFIFPYLDFSVGKQRINWGTADVLNPTDVLNPLDLSDPLDFGKKTPSLAAVLTCYIPAVDGSIQAVFEPYSQVARLNPLIIGKISGNLYSSLVAALALNAAGIGFSFIDSSPAWSAETAETPAADLKNFAAGGKIAAQLAGFDLSANYVTRINDMPYIKALNAETTAHLTTSALSLDERAYTLGYYREQEIGFDFAKDWGFLLTWGEAAVFLQDEQLTTGRTESYTDPVPSGPAITETTAIAVADEPYVKYTAGMSRNLPGGLYFNLQYNHGFFYERGNTGAERLQDYALLRLEYTTLASTLKIGITGLANLNNIYDAFQAADFNAYVADNYGLMGNCDLEYMPLPGFSITLGVMLFDGKVNSTIGQMKDNDFAFIRVKAQF